MSFTCITRRLGFGFYFIKLVHIWTLFHATFQMEIKKEGQSDDYLSF